MTESEAEKAFREVLQEHEELKKIIADLREFLQTRQPEVEEEGCHPWAAGLLARMATLHDKVCCHFRHEEDAGLVEELSRRHPHAAKKIEILLVDHEEILKGIRDLMMGTLSYSEGKSPEDPNISGRLGGILDRLVSHEKVETDLITRIEYDDIGSGE